MRFEIYTTALALVAAVSALPVAPATERDLINISPDVNIAPEILGGDNSCLGIGISVCDPINVDDKKQRSE